MLFEERLIFLPTRHPAGWWDGPKIRGLAVEDVWMDTSDGERIHGWFAPGPDGDGPVILYFHGNAGNLSDRTDFVQTLVGEGLSVFIVDYRGYGRSSGRPNEAGLYRDAEAAWDYLVTTRNVPAERIVILGRSLGGGVATELAVRRPNARGLILESTFRSIAHIGQRQFPFLPVRLLLRTRFDNLAKVPEIRVPTLVVHGTADRLIPFEEGKALYEALPDGQKHFHAVEGGEHNDTWARGGESYLKAIRAFATGS